MHGLLRIGDGGYTIPWLHLEQSGVPTSYDIGGLSLSELHNALVNSTTKTTTAATNESAANHVQNGTSSLGSVTTSGAGSTRT
jgi:hypothetical protein